MRILLILVGGAALLALASCADDDDSTSARPSQLETVLPTQASSAIPTLAETPTPTASPASPVLVVDSGLTSDNLMVIGVATYYLSQSPAMVLTDPPACEDIEGARDAASTDVREATDRENSGRLCIATNQSSIDDATAKIYVRHYRGDLLAILQMEVQGNDWIVTSTLVPSSS